MSPREREVGERSQLQRRGRVGVAVPPGGGDVRRRREDALGHARRLQQRPQLLPPRDDGSQVFLVRAPGHGAAAGNGPQLGEEQRHPGAADTGAEEVKLLTCCTKVKVRIPE